MSKILLSYGFASFLSLLALAGSCSAQEAPQLTLTQFTDCVGPDLYDYDQGTGICDLMPNSSNGGYWVANSTIYVTRSSILLEGANFSTAGIERGSSSMDAIMSISADDVTVYY